MNRLAFITNMDGSIVTKRALKTGAEILAIFWDSCRYGFSILYWLWKYCKRQKREKKM